MKRAIPALALENVSFSYGPVSCLTEMTLSLEAGRFHGLIGPNGSGKSTLLDLLCGYLQPGRGNVKLDGTDLRKIPSKQRARRLASVPQSFSLNFDYRVEDVVMMGRHPYIPRFLRPDDQDLQAVNEALHTLDVHHLKDRNVTQLSGGEKQRVMLARALAQDTDIILLDEVTSNLDINHAVSIMKAMSDIVIREKKTVIAALHDLNIAATFCDRLVVLQNGTLAAQGGTSAVLSEELIKNLYQIEASISEDQITRKKHIKFSYI